jgi:putative transposase
MTDEQRVPFKRACRWVGLSRAAYYRGPMDGLVRDGAVIEALNGVVERNSRWGFWKCNQQLRSDGRPWNHKRVWRVYCDMGLNLPRRTKKRLPQRDPVPLQAGQQVNQGWALDIEVGTSIPARTLIRSLSRLVDWYGTPDSIRLDNGPEMTSQDFTEWASAKGIALRFIEPGGPTRTPTSSASTGPTGPRSSTRTCPDPSNRCSTSPRSGCSSTTSSALTTPWARCLRGSSCPGSRPPRTPVLGCRLDGGAYAPSYRRVMLHWVTHAKQAATRERSLAQLMAACAEQRRILNRRPFQRALGRPSTRSMSRQSTILKFCGPVGSRL